MSESTVTITLSTHEICTLEQALYTEINSLKRKVNMFAREGESWGEQLNRASLNRCEDLRYALNQALSNAVEVSA